MTAAAPAVTATDPRPVPALRLCAAELRWVLRRPRTLIMFGLFALVPILIAIGIVVADGDGDGNGGPGLIGSIGGNGLVLPIAAMTISLTLLLPLAVAVASADAIAGEASRGTLRGLLLSPVGRLRLVGMKAFGVLVVAAVATLVIAVVGVLAGLVVVGGADGQLVTLSGTTVGLGEAFGRVGLVALWTVGQLAAVGAVALAVSSFTEHPLVVLASVLGGLITFGVLSAIPALDWLQPYLLTTGWSSAADALRDPLPLDGFASSSVVALVYLLVGGAVLVIRMLRRDA